MTFRFISLCFATVLVFAVGASASSEVANHLYNLDATVSSPETEEFSPETLPLPDVMPSLPCAFDDWSGLSAAEAESLARETERPYRLIKPGMPVTQDFSPARINIELDEKETVIRVFCG